MSIFKKYLPVIMFIFILVSNTCSWNAIAQPNFKNDAEWFSENIPFIDVPDKEIMDIYYYRWEMYKRHFRNLGELGYIITEFAPSVSWEGPYSGISAAAGHHIYEGRWIKDRTYIDDYIAFWFKGHGNQFQYSSWLCDALYNYFLINGDKQWIKDYLPAMITDYQGWEKKRFDGEKGIYWQKPVEDATEFTVAGYMVNDGWGGDAYRPTINTFMYANALAIYKVAVLCNEKEVADTYLLKANELKENVQSQLWNNEMQHFADRFTSRYIDLGLDFRFINAPELNGYVPWMFSLPDDNEKYIQAWKKLLDNEVFYAPYGPTTISKKSPYYMVETRTPNAKPGLGECEWNGPSWPYQTSQILMGMSNILNYYQQTVINKADYFNLLKIYTGSQYKNGKPYIAENLHPETGNWIADFPNRSEHYNHSTYNDLILNGLLGIHPQSGDYLVLNPLIPDNWDYFMINNLSYHGHTLKILYDKNGSHYKEKLKGLNVFINGKLTAKKMELKTQTISIPDAKTQKKVNHIINYAFNNKGKGFPKVSASFTSEPDNIYDAIDGRLWYDEYPHNRWTTLGSGKKEEWFEIDLGEDREVNAINACFYDDGASVLCPEKFILEYWDGTDWKIIRECSKLKSFASNRFTFKRIKASKFHLIFNGLSSAVGLSEVEIGLLN